MATSLPAGWLPGIGTGGVIVGAGVNDIVQLIATRARRPIGDGSSAEVEVVREIAHAQRILEEGPTLPWFLRATVDVPVLANVGELPLIDTGFAVLRLQDDKPVSYIDPTGEAVEPVELAQEAELLLLHQKYPGSAELPREYYVDDATIILRPIPTQDLTFRVRVYRRADVPVDDATTLWTTNFPDLLMNMAGYEWAWSLRDDAAAARFDEDHKRARSRYVKAVAARDDAGQVHVMGDP